VHSAGMSVDSMKAARSPSASPKLRLSQLRKLRECEQVAAVCYRLRHGEIEFLLVQTGGGRWIFPKGGVEPGLTHAQSAALEAFEEAGVHGRMEENSFTRYLHRDRGGARRSNLRSSKSARKSPFVLAYLCEVLRLTAPQESNRNRTWFSAQKAKRRLGEDRTAECAAEFARVVDRAVARIQRQQGATPATASPAQQSQPRENLLPKSDALRKVPFEASEVARIQSPVRGASFVSYIHRRIAATGPSTAIEMDINPRPALRLLR
jgi:8-oxo-dGTP pyrophosphatase MutT (NUDIX family)